VVVVPSIRANIVAASRQSGNNASICSSTAGTSGRPSVDQYVLGLLESLQGFQQQRGRTERRAGQLVEPSRSGDRQHRIVSPVRGPGRLGTTTQQSRPRVRAAKTAR
jgi:hypothetical protein